MQTEPLRPAQPSPPPQSSALVVEDTPAVGELFQDVLQGHFGWQTVVANSVAAAIVHLEREAVDFVLCDFAMAGGNGLELVVWLGAHRPALAQRVLLVTASTGHANLEQALSRGEVRVLFKPFNVTQLIQAIERTVQAAPR